MGFPLNASVELFKSFVSPLGTFAPHKSWVAEGAASKLCDMLSNYGPDLEGESFERDPLVSGIGIQMLGEKKFRACMAWRESQALDEASGPEKVSAPKVRE